MPRIRISAQRIKANKVLYSRIIGVLLPTHMELTAVKRLNARLCGIEEKRMRFLLRKRVKPISMSIIEWTVCLPQLELLRGSDGSVGLPMCDPGPVAREVSVCILFVFKLSDYSTTK